MTSAGENLLPLVPSVGRSGKREPGVDKSDAAVDIQKMFPGKIPSGLRCMSLKAVGIIRSRILVSEIPQKRLSSTKSSKKALPICRLYARIVRPAKN